MILSGFADAQVDVWCHNDLRLSDYACVYFNEGLLYVHL
jgi:hypothetical protein